MVESVNEHAHVPDFGGVHEQKVSNGSLGEESKWILSSSGCSVSGWHGRVLFKVFGLLSNSVCSKIMISFALLSEAT